MVEAYTLGRVFSWKTKPPVQAAVGAGGMENSSVSQAERKEKVLWLKGDEQGWRE